MQVTSVRTWRIRFKKIDLQENTEAMNVSLLLGAKAEVVIATLLVVRHRTVRLAFVSALTMVVLSFVQGLQRTTGTQQPGTLFLIAGTLAAVAGSRLLAPGGALAASRQVATRWWLVPVGRLAGVLLVVFPIVTVAAFFTGLASPDPVMMSLAIALYTAAVASLVLSLSPILGASAAAALGIVTVWAGVVPPAGVQTLFAKWPVVQRATALIWHLLPLQWRAGRFIETCAWMDALVLVGWIVFGLLSTCWVMTSFRSADRRFREVV